MDITQYKTVNKGALQAVFTLRIPKWGNFLIRDMTYFKKANQRWVSFPSRPYEKDGETKYYQYNMFEEKTMGEAFQKRALEALDKYISENPVQASMDQKKMNLDFND